MDHTFRESRAGATFPGVRRLDCGAMDRRLARRNIRLGLIVGMICLLMFALTFVAALAYDGV
jgi:hypothetical protein